MSDKALLELFECAEYNWFHSDGDWRYDAPINAVCRKLRKRGWYQATNDYTLRTVWLRLIP